MTDRELEDLFAKAREAGLKAGMEVVPTPMIVREEFPNPGRTYAPVMDGVCGFAWVTIKPGTCRAARMAKQLMQCHRGYHGGVEIWVSDFNQSLTRKEAYATAFARVLRDAGIQAYPGSRMD